MSATAPRLGPYVVGLTGGIASGKSTVSATLAELGAAVVDTDLISRELVRPGQPALREIRTSFGEQVIASDGSLDRHALRAIVFADAQERARLEAILHPRIRAEARTQVERARGPYVLLVVPLLVESGGYGWVDRVLVVDASLRVQAQLLMARDGIEAEAARAMIATQADRQTRLTNADDVIRNSAGLAELRIQAQAVHRRYHALAMACPGSHRPRTAHDETTAALSSAINAPPTWVGVRE